MKKYLNIFLSLLLLAVGIGGVYFIETMKDNLNKKEVLVLARDIKFKEKIELSDLAIDKVPVEQIVEGAYKPQDAELVVGSYAAINMKKGMQLYDALIDTHDLIPNEAEGEFVAPIPDEWLYAIPGTLRRSYVADFYAIPVSDDRDKLLEIISEDKDLEDIDLNELNINDLDSKNSLTTEFEPFLKNVRVAHVQDRNNREVVTSEEDGTSATSVATRLEIIANDEILNTIRNTVENGYQIYIVYRFDRLDEDEMVADNKNEQTGEEDVS